jgi:hypothetical protein
VSPAQPNVASRLLTKAIHIELTHERREVRMLEELRQEFPAEVLSVWYYKPDNQVGVTKVAELGLLTEK